MRLNLLNNLKKFTLNVIESKKKKNICFGIKKNYCHRQNRILTKNVHIIPKTIIHQKEINSE